MRQYVKGYLYRVTTIIVSIAIVVAFLLFSFVLFQRKLSKVSGQLNSYESSDYSIIYILNYGEGLNNECLYPDTDIQFYLDNEKTNRLACSSVMKEDGALYDLTYLSALSSLNPGEASMSQNVADLYGLKIGDSIFAEYSYSSTSIPVKIVSLVGTEFDFSNPVIDNDVGIIFLGYNADYCSSTNSKYLVFASQSKAEELSTYPQIINKVINKSINSQYVSEQSCSALIFEVIFSLISIILAQILFFSKSRVLLYRCYLKGMKKALMILIPFAERIAFCLFPCLIVQLITTAAIPKSSIGDVYMILPVMMSAFFCILTLVIDLFKQSRKG